MNKTIGLVDPVMAEMLKGIDELERSYRQVLLELKEAREGLNNVRFHIGMSLANLEPLEEILPKLSSGRNSLTHGQLSLHTSLEIIRNILGDEKDIEEAEKEGE